MLFLELIGEQKVTVVVSILQVQVEHRKQKQQMPLTVVKGVGPTLLGRKWLPVYSARLETNPQPED